MILLGKLIAKKNHLKTFSFRDLGFLGAKLIPNFFILITGERKSINCALLSKKVASDIA